MIRSLDSAMLYLSPVLKFSVWTKRMSKEQKRKNFCVKIAPPKI